MYYDPLVALVNISPVEKLSDENSKKKSRWENNLSNNNIENKIIPSKWGSEEHKPYLPLPFVDFPPGLTPSQLDQFLREQRYDELTKKLNKGELEYVDPDIRPASPPPIYDKNGSRINTREARIKNSMIEEHHRLVEYLLKHVEGFVAPSNYKPIKKIRKIEIPIDKYPEYNFMGLIIGPRGCNHKRLEAESGAQISIRGKGTQKEGKKTDHQTEIEANMPKHVHISADSEECVEKAVSLITPLLDPFHPLHEEYKRKGLEQLALVNGINLNQLDTQRCSICNSMTHLTFECPENMNLQNFKKPEIKCNLCGDHGHITLDCKLAKQKNYMKNDIDNPNNIPTPPYTNMPPPPFDPMKNHQYNSTNKFDKIKMDLEYQKMMSEISTDKNNNNQQNDELNKKSNDNIYNNSNVNDNFMKSTNNFNNFNEANNNSFNESTMNYVDSNNKFQNNLQNTNKSFNNMMPPVNNKNINNPNFIPIAQNNSTFIDEKRNTNSPNYYDPHANNRNPPPIRNSNGKNFNTMMNFPNINNMPLNPPLPILPNFFNFPFINNRMVQNNPMSFPNNHQIPIDPLYMQNFQNWTQMPMNYSDEALIHAAAPETNPPPLPSENMNINNNDNETNI
ncbi:transcription or splicing factor-like protein, putative [Plasmodium gallinaceum]|uniref:Branchpoint-bridging protein n=1 Tax=Plasmodium gallinaceum TaxID=5849 RepID=A0A1J1GN99_PLAGA|nr:transcription or splicing factor-like protein, putative [Plasmodium gallinaceum]CRG93812.1 transcription or splicing factor-like protein, putative [Plasmodium gallinaceum]